MERSVLFAYFAWYLIYSNGAIENSYRFFVVMRIIVLISYSVVPVGVFHMAESLFFCVYSVLN
jgi:hypothetical protein